MSKGAFLFGLVLSLAGHWWLLSGGQVRPRGETFSTQDPKRIEVTVQAVQNLEKMVSPVSEIKHAKQGDLKRPLPASPKPTVKTPPEDPSPQKADTTESSPDTLQQSPHALHYSNEPRKGTFAGSRTGLQQPLLRINWGSQSQAVNILRVGGMRLVLLGPDLHVKATLTQNERGQWRRQQGITDSLARYSSNMRIVDQVPAFQPFCKSNLIKPQERLAIMIPLELERQIDAAKLAAASQRGLPLEQIEIFGGTFTADDHQVSFRIDRLLERIEK